MDLFSLHALPMAWDFGEANIWVTLLGLGVPAANMSVHSGHYRQDAAAKEYS